MNVQSFTPLTVENAHKVSLVSCIDHPEWGNKRFNFDPSSNKFHSHGTGSNSAILFESEFKFWKVESFKREKPFAL
jgi:hypothetical protein